jgi:hypothetical protein
MGQPAWSPVLRVGLFLNGTIKLLAHSIFGAIFI